MVRIRLGFIGLTATPTSWAPRAHLPYLVRSPYYEIYGIYNRTKETAKAAIKAHNLSPSIRIFSSLDELTADPNVDLVVVCTRVDTHYQLARPVIEAGKNIFVEWPLGTNLEQALDLVSLAKVKGVATMIGLQGRMSLAIRKIKDLVESGTLGTIFSVSICGVATNLNVSMPEKYAYFADKRSGGNILTIRSLHILDTMFYVHGEPTHIQSQVDNLMPYIQVQHSDGRIEHLEKDTPDQIAISGRLKASSAGELDPSFVFHMRAGRPFKDQPELIWHVYGEKGQLEITCESAGLQMGYPLTVKKYDHATESVELIVKSSQLDDGFWADLPRPARNVGRLYEAYALSRPYGDWDLALQRHKLLDNIQRTEVKYRDRGSRTA
ncbi:uncharacterized protein Z519_01822 [Cladophialophora bantiana CBS 173.52]|uniref:Gfo/Idh/MocA-like oxidoreductase N-terminal domain-containing protein n=1 Tax=Cladophialophora bantiana (strain ATCC 10958 / CBS 173.52 / CDC B-1940 / NIH 8579) TaxID=1442370 RepID=A0A0D2HXU5_CLAB1|nr:uncharacterized protein Z519_01822 [Cladophialophora bantiana CBS 173.52]KIW98238.1 hypothetical protein Z519_01822 [Cladophialophora bantiana CBS 173.52]